MTFDFYQGRSPKHVPAYTVSRGARILRMSPSTLRTWVHGYHASGTRRPRLITPAQTSAPCRLSFSNLVEAFVLTALRKEHFIELAKIRRTLKHLEDNLRVAQPLATKKFATDGVELFVETVAGLLHVGNDGRAELRTNLEALVGRIEYVDGSAARLFPIVRRSAVPSDQVPRIIVIDPERAFGAPSVDGTGIAVEILRQRFEAGDSVETLVAEFNIDPMRVQEALRAAA